MIRFMPDTWRDALLRPIAMAAPNSNVYVETNSPDLRFVFITLLLLAWAIYWLRSRTPLLKGLVVTGALVIAAFVTWLLTSGNGRYFIPILMLAGPVCLGLLCALPVTRGMKAALASLLLSLQGFVVFGADPVGVWAMAHWRNGGYFEVKIPSTLKAEPHTFVLATSISYSLIAPQFHPQSEWVNIANLGEASIKTLEQDRTSALLKRATSLVLLLPVVPIYASPDGQPTAAAKTAIASLLAVQRLEFIEDRSCLFLPSRGMASVLYRDLSRASVEEISHAGFWACEVRLNEALTMEATNVVKDPRINSVFSAVEKACPRLFQPGQVTATKIDGGYTRAYGGSDIMLYVMDDGIAYYKYWRALNPIAIGNVADVMTPGFQMDCNNIRGRSGLPWEREI